VLLEIVLALVKILLVVGFCLNFSAIAVWADRRQSAMIQHRVGPNRAVIYLPSIVIAGVLAAPGFLIGAAAILGLGRAPSGYAALDRMGLSLQLLAFTATVRSTHSKPRSAGSCRASISTAASRRMS
jgi:NADH-quinone oxidoreductase subunit H